MEVDGSKVMTVLGPVRGEDIGPVLMNEHVICDPSTENGNQRYLSEIKSFGSACKEFNIPMTMENLACVRSKPFSHTGNMSLSSTNDAYRELEHLTPNCNTVLDSTNIAHGRSYKLVESLALRLGINILIGTSCSKLEAGAAMPQNNMEEGKENIARMETELLHGIDKSNIRAGFIGEVQVPEKFDESGWWELKVSAMVQSSTNAPLLVAETTPAKYANKILDQIVVHGGKTDRTILSHMDMYVTDLDFLKKILNRGAFLCFDRFTVSSACFDPDQSFPTVKQVVECIHSLIQDSISYLDQIVLSSGIFMKLQYRKHGGVGYNSLFEHVLPRLKAKGISEDQIQTLVHHNPRRLLQWWTPPPEPVKPKEYIPCSVCRKLFEPILGEYYTKFTFSYCGTDCLRQHREMGFKELEQR